MSVGAERAVCIFVSNICRATLRVAFLFTTVQLLVMLYTNDFAVAAQGAAAAAFQEGAIVLNKELEPKLGIILKAYAGNVYGILFFIPVPGEGREYYRYSIVNGEQITDQIPDRISVSTKMHLKIASMIVRNPIRDTDYYLLRKGGVEDGKL